MIYGIVFAISIAIFGLWGSVEISASVLIIGILIMVVYSYLPQLKEVFIQFRPKKTDAPDTNSTQKISAIGKTIFGALKKIIYWVIIAGLIAAAALVAYCFLFPSAKPGLLNHIPFFSSSFSQPQPKTKVVYYTPNTQTQTVYVGKGKWKFRIATTKGYYELPKRGRIKARRTQVPVVGEPSRNTTIPLLPCKNMDYYGGVLVNLLPNSSVVKSDDRGCVKISLNLPKEIKEVKGRKIKLIFTSIS